MIDSLDQLPCVPAGASTRAERAASVEWLRDRFREAVLDLQCDVALEVGAFEASFAVWAVEHVAVIEAVAVEASPNVYDHFSPRLAVTAPSVEYVHAAVGECDGDVEFLVQSHHDGKRLIGFDSRLRRCREMESRAVRVPGVRLDTLYGRRRWFDRRVALWLDVEGQQRLVLEGGRSAIASTTVALVEVESRRFWRDQWLDVQVVEAFTAAGLVPVARDRQTAAQYNILFVREGEQYRA